ncbi:MAG: hypothetical protein J6X98_05780 [Bacteroidales bacterium]|nr:hypothetical protein [Bacteroidales bacterium]
MGGGDDVSGNGALSPAAHLFPFPHPAAHVIPPPTLGGGGTPTLQESIVRRRHFPAKEREREPLVPEARHPNNPTRNGVPCGVADGA